ncbi:MAG: hypothetical protein MUC41_15720 [Syntrophobacteraceae bacterium]|jgi:Fe-S cluster assembly iron-binding protein IscA|nr:hypothetical protein [Syntrophobacteraceae bacterium]
MVLDEPKDTDDVYKVNGFTLVMDKELYKRTKAVTVDYVNYGFGAGFKLTCEVPISNGSTCGSCSC